ncbi:VOC family protein [Parafilimonas terrae]|jgi:predicted enzyme related to lactoylglutathione lyase|uniref:VOC domain-containing protein n=1 Tax=Parafilimonas terrae TaxID=1465490 RepID=A0A1I5YM56_9BACT|nr:VOC family protein [Parafilimonas terrae]SFQ45165.1 hypothetical protein SAMN05444277_11314 [Parafilimonas terrae]
MKNKQINPAVWFEVYVNDMERATRFYESVLNVKLQQMSDPTDATVQMKAFPSAGENFGASGSLVKMEGMKGGGNGVMIYFGCEDCAAEESRVEAAGGNVYKPKMSIGEYGFCSIVSDTEGNMFGLHSMQ